MTKKTLGRSALSRPAQAALHQLGKDLAFARGRRGQSLREAAERLQVSINTVRNLEAGHPGVGLGILANALALYGMLDRLGALADPATDRIGLALERRRQERQGASANDALSFDV